RCGCDPRRTSGRGGERPRWGGWRQPSDRRRRGVGLRSHWGRTRRGVASAEWLAAGGSGHLGHLERAGLHRDGEAVVQAPVLDDLAVLEAVDRPRLDVLDRDSACWSRYSRNAAHVLGAEGAADEDLVAGGEDVLHLEFAVFERLHRAAVRHLGTFDPLRNAGRTVV